MQARSNCKEILVRKRLGNIFLVNNELSKIKCQTKIISTKNVGFNFPYHTWIRASTVDFLLDPCQVWFIGWKLGLDFQQEEIPHLITAEPDRQVYTDIFGKRFAVVFSCYSIYSECRNGLNCLDPANFRYWCRGLLYAYLLCWQYRYGPNKPYTTNVPQFLGRSCPTRY